MHPKLLLLIRKTGTVPVSAAAPDSEGGETQGPAHSQVTPRLRALSLVQRPQTRLPAPPDT